MKNKLSLGVAERHLRFCRSGHCTKQPKQGEMISVPSPEFPGGEAEVDLGSKSSRVRGAQVTAGPVGTGWEMPWQGDTQGGGRYKLIGHRSE